jgi:hypothetical protein
MPGRPYPDYKRIYRPLIPSVRIPDEERKYKHVLEVEKKQTPEGILVLTLKQHDHEGLKLAVREGRLNPRKGKPFVVSHELMGLWGKHVRRAGAERIVWQLEPEEKEPLIKALREKGLKL